MTNLPTAHANLGASGAHRWIPCPGSVALSEGLPDESSPHAREGTAAHELASMCLEIARGGLYIARALSRKSQLICVEGEDFEVTQEMAEAVQVYLDHISSRLAVGFEIVGVEMRVDLSALNPPAPMFGTVDCALWHPGDKILEIVDYKHGRGVVVEAKMNPQPRYYALGTVIKLKVRPEKIISTIVQPRADHPDGHIRHDEFDFEELVEFKNMLMDAARAACEDDAPVGPVGDHCRWCKAKAICPAQAANAVAVVQSEFDALPDDVAAFPVAADMETSRLLEVLDKAGLVEDWFGSIRAYVKGLLESGQEVPGWKLVDKRATRKWVDDAEAEAWLRQRFKVSEAYKQTVISPAQAEKLVKTKKRLRIPAEMITKQSSGTNLVSADNPKLAVKRLTAADEFEAA